jgi:CheY-like chemotaxis protein
MDKSTVYSKTAKGMGEFMAGGKNLAREHARVLALINGRSSIGDLINTGGLVEGRYAPAIEALLSHGLIRKFETTQHHKEVLEFARPSSDDDLFDTPPAITVEELSPQESVQVWAQARRGATELASTGFYSYGSKGTLGAAAGAASLKALVIEDDEELAELLVVLLSEKGVTVQVAPDLPKAIATVKAGEVPDFVLLDIVLPGMPGKDGFDLLAFIRRVPGWTKVPVVMVTSEVSDTQVMKGLKLGADGYIFKPFKWEALYGCIRAVAGI